MMTDYIAGIDYSLTSPSICVYIDDDKEWNYKKCKFFYIVKSEKNVFRNSLLHGMTYPEYKSDPQRYSNLASWVNEICNVHSIKQCYIEGYSYNSVGRVFQIAENTGVLKHNLWKRDIPYQVFAPTTIKKFATGKGNANKEKMYESFYSETNIDLFKELEINNPNNWNPVSDIVDAYFIAKFGHQYNT